MRNLAKKLTCGVLLSLLNGSLSACGVASEVATTHPSSSSMVEPVATPAAHEEADDGRHRATRPAAARNGAATREPGRPVATASVAMPVANASSVSGAGRAASVAGASPVSAVGMRNMRTQSGRIIDEAGQPLIGATVLLKGTTRGTSTDANGDYSLAVPLGVNTFVFAYSGYADEVAQSSDGQPLTVTLLPATGRPAALSQEKESKSRAHKKRQ